jgi:ribonucleotide reductase alpha subunit
MSNLYQTNGRLSAAKETEESFGFSCNFYQVRDSLVDISKARDWVSMVCSRSGAPSVDLSHLRPKGSPIRRGGNSYGAVPFADSFDAIMYSAVRTHTTNDGEVLNKNHAGLIGLDINHADLKDFLATEFKIASKVVYITAGQAIPEDKLQLCYEYYRKQPKLFFHKRKANPFDEQKFGLTGTNLCTEIKDMQTKDTCILGTINLANYRDFADVQANFAKDLLASASSLIDTDRAIKAAKYDNPKYTSLVSYDSNNMQVGLSVVGLATLLGRLGIPYSQFVGSILSFVLAEAYKWASEQLKKRYPSYVRVFTQAPTVHSHLRFTDGVTGLSVSPSIEPVQGFEIEDTVYCRIVSQTHGNRLFEHPGGTPTMSNTTFADYRNVAEYWQLMLDATGLAQGISFSVYETQDEPFTYGNFTEFFSSPLHSLYYFMPIAPIDNNVLGAKFDKSPIKVACGFDPTQRMNTDQCECAG